ncbi:MAG: transposase [Endomicrobium sp.]|jgi:transposase|nr:transposase [Endomicrobium sp.]
MEKSLNPTLSQNLPGYIHYETKDSGVYARYCYSSYKKNGLVYHNEVNLGRTLNKEKGIFKNRQRGFYTFTLKDGFGIVDPEDIIYAEEAPKNVVLNFGDIWLTDQILKKTGLDTVLDNLIPSASNTIKSLVAFRLLEHDVYDTAEDWYRKSYARILYPGARVESTQISKFHSQFGQENIYTKFFENYLAIMTNNTSINTQIPIPILIDSTGLPNDIKTHLTAINNHNGVVSNEIRLIYVVDKRTKLPIFFRYVPGNLIDNSVLLTTLNLLCKHNVNIEVIIMDAAYSSLSNLSQLVSANIPFITRLTKNRKEHKEIIEKYGPGLKCPANAITFGDRVLFGKVVPIHLCGKQLYAYLMLDLQQEAADQNQIIHRFKDEPDGIKKMESLFKSAGMFIILASDKYEKSEILPMYYQRQIIEQVFDISKNFADIIPLRAHSEETIRGRLLISFIASVIYSSISQRLKNKTRLCANKAICKMHHLQIKIYENSRFIEDLTKDQKEIFTVLGLQCPYPEEKGNLLKRESFLASLNYDSHNRKRGRPKGSKYKDKAVRHPTADSGLEESDAGSKESPKRGRGRPKGSKNKEKTVGRSTDSGLEVKYPGSKESPKRGRGRPKGSTNKKKTVRRSTSLFGLAPREPGSKESPKRGRGRPKGRKNKKKGVGKI